MVTEKGSNAAHPACSVLRSIIDRYNCITCLALSDNFSDIPFPFSGRIKMIGHNLYIL